MQKPQMVAFFIDFILATALWSWSRLTQTEMSTRNISYGGNGDRCEGMTTFRPTCANCLKILGASTSSSPRGLSTAVQGYIADAPHTRLSHPIWLITRIVSGEKQYEARLYATVSSPLLLHTCLGTSTYLSTLTQLMLFPCCDRPSFTPMKTDNIQFRIFWSSYS
jgi:hypothetical protein